jgi:hypothetical protein
LREDRVICGEHRTFAARSHRELTLYEIRIMPKKEAT